MFLNYKQNFKYFTDQVVKNRQTGKKGPVKVNFSVMREAMTQMKDYMDKQLGDVNLNKSIEKNLANQPKRDMEIMKVVYWTEYSKDPALNLIILVKDPYDIMDEVKIKAKNIEQMIKKESAMKEGNVMKMGLKRGKFTNFDKVKKVISESSQNSMSSDYESQKRDSPGKHLDASSEKSSSNSFETDSDISDEI